MRTLWSRSCAVHQLGHRSKLACNDHCRTCNWKKKDLGVFRRLSRQRVLLRVWQRTVECAVRFCYHAVQRRSRCTTSHNYPRNNVGSSGGRANAWFRRLHPRIVTVSCSSVSGRSPRWSGVHCRRSNDFAPRQQRHDEHAWRAGRHHRIRQVHRRWFFVRRIRRQSTIHGHVRHQPRVQPSFASCARRHIQ